MTKATEIKKLRSKKEVIPSFNGSENYSNKSVVKTAITKDKAGNTGSLKMQHSLDVSGRIEELRLIENGWLDGDGLAMDKEGLNWFSKSFEENFSPELPRPYIFPLPDGGIQMEWNNTKYSANLELNLVDKKAEYYCITKQTKEIYEEDLDFNDKTTWITLNELLKILL